MRTVYSFVAALIATVPAVAIAAEDLATKYRPGGIRGLTLVWLLANVSYAGMRAQNHPSTSWRVASFLFGFPGTFISFLAIREGGESAYGIKLPVAQEQKPPHD